MRDKETAAREEIDEITQTLRTVDELIGVELQREQVEREEQSRVEGERLAGAERLALERWCESYAKLFEQFRDEVAPALRATNDWWHSAGRPLGAPPHVLRDHFPTTFGSLLRLVYTSAHNRDWSQHHFAGEIVGDLGRDEPIIVSGTGVTAAPSL